MSTLRTVTVLLAFAVAFVGSLEVVRRGLERLDGPDRPVGLNVAGIFLGSLEEIRTSRASRPGSVTVAFLGDSISLRTQRGADLPTALGRALAEPPGTRPVRLHSLAALGMGPFDWYFLADELAAARPDVVVVALSLQTFGEASRPMSRTRLSGWLAPARVPEALLGPMHWVGLRADDLLMNVAIVRAGYAEAWRRAIVVQTRFGVARDELAEWVAGLAGVDPRAVALPRLAYGLRRGRLPERDRYDRETQSQQFGTVLRGVEKDHPVLEVLADTLTLLRAHDVATLVYVNPINVAHMTSLGLPEGDRLARSLATIESVVVASGGVFIDLHARVPDDDAFWDAAGHMGTVDQPDALERVASSVVGPLRELVEATGQRSVRTGSR